MKTTQVLLLEDDGNDAELIVRQLRRSQIPCNVRRVITRKDFIAALGSSDLDLILSDFILPEFTGYSSLELAREHAPRVPFIFVSGLLGEEQAIEAVKSGATDYVLKDRLQRLGPVVQRALEESADRKRLQRAEDQVREQAALLDKASDAIFVYGMKGEITFWNARCERIYGWSNADVLGRNIEDLVFKQTKVDLDACRSSALNVGEWIGRQHQATSSGDVIAVECRLTLLRDEKGQPSGFLAMNTDIREKQELEQQFFRAQRLESIGTLAEGVAHDINNALGPVPIALAILREEALDDHVRGLLGTVDASISRTIDLTKQLLDYARGVEGERVLLPLAELLGEIARVVRQTFSRHITVREELADDLWVVYGDALQIHQVVLNLCLNARDAMPDGGALTIRAENRAGGEPDRAAHGKVDGPVVVITIQDTGSGVPEGLRERIFEPFFTTKERVKGTGLGLSTVQTIVTSHGGSVELDDGENGGARFIVTLPADPNGCAAQVIGHAAVVEVCAPEVALKLRRPSESILVVDDEELICDVTRAVLENHGYHVRTACNGREAVECYREHHDDIDLVLTDLMMPVMNGIEAAGELRKINPDVKLIVGSGVATHEHLAEVSRVENVNAFLSKPYTPEKLLDTLSRALAA